MFTSIVGTASVPARGSTFMRPVPPMMPPSLCSSSAHRFICITADQPRCGRLRASMLLRVGLLAAPLAADGQQPGKMWRIGYLGTFPMDPQSEIGRAVILTVGLTLTPLAAEAQSAGKVPDRFHPDRGA